MIDKTIEILIYENSDILFEGLSCIISNSPKKFKITRIANMSDILTIEIQEEPKIFIINPQLIVNKEKEFLSAKKMYPDSCWIALLYSFIDPQLTSFFGKNINVNDSLNNIINLLIRSAQEITNHSNGPEFEQLSERETDVLKEIVAGYSNKEIADRLNISIHTVISHRKNISQKTGIKSQAGLTIYAISNKIVNIDDFS